MDWGLMREKEFRSYCIQRGFDSNKIDTGVTFVQRLESFMTTHRITNTIDNLTPTELNQYISHTLQTGANSFDHLVALLRYFHVVNNEPVKVALYELLDGAEVMDNLAKKIKETEGTEKHRRIFEGIPLPPLGTPNEKKFQTTKKVVDRLEKELDPQTCQTLLSSGLHQVARETYLPARDEFLKAKNIDEFLRKRHEEFVKVLEKHGAENSLFFTQKIDDEVITYVRATPMCAVGVRKGNIVNMTKIPYLTKQYLNEENPQMKRYYYCHCPWVREAIKVGYNEISSTFCYCSAGFTKQFWDVVLDQPVKVEVVDTVLQGGMVCQFAIHLPSEVVGAVESK